MDLDDYWPGWNDGDLMACPNCKAGHGLVRVDSGHKVLNREWSAFTWRIHCMACECKTDWWSSPVAAIAAWERHESSCV